MESPRGASPLLRLTLGIAGARRYAMLVHRKEFERLKALGVEFTQGPVELGPVSTAVFDDTCGNLIQIAQSS